MEEEAYKALNCGRYHKAKNYFEYLLAESNTHYDKSHYRAEIAACERYIREVSRTGIGEASFPVFYEPINAAIPLTIIVSQSGNKRRSIFIEKVWEEVKLLLTDFLDRYLSENRISAVVFDWGLDDYSPSIKQFPNHDNKYDEIVDNMIGESVTLAIFMAALSVIIETPIPGTVSFSASLEKVGHNIVLKRVNDKTIPAKSESIRDERPWVKSLFVSSHNEIKNKIVYGAHDIKEVVENVFPEFETIIISKQNSLGKNDGQRGRRSINLKVFENVETVDHKIHYYLYFKHGKILLDDIPKIIEYFKRLPENFVRQEKGVIIDGLLVSFLIPILLLQPSVFNHVSNFIAIRYTGSDKGKETGAIVVRTGNTAVTRKLGEVIRYIQPY